MPLLLASMGLFVLATYLLVSPTGQVDFREQIERARRDVRLERYDAAVGRLNDVLAARPEGPDEAAARLLVSEAIDQSIRRSRRADAPPARRRILREISSAFEVGAHDAPELADRAARSWEALGKVDEAAIRWRDAVRMLDDLDREPEGVPMRRSLIEMFVAHNRPAGAAQELKGMLELPGLADDERAWALGELARLSVDAGRPDEAMPLLAEALSLSPDAAIQGQVNYRLGYAAWKLGDHGGAEGYLSLARQQLGTGHALDAEACYLLGRITQAKIGRGDAATDAELARQATGFYDIVIRDHPGSRTTPRARIGRSVARLILGDADGGAADLLDAADEFNRRPGLEPLKPDLLDALARGSRILTERGRPERAVELLAAEQRVQGDRDDLTAGYFARLGSALERRGDLLAARVDRAPEPDRPGLDKLARNTWVKAGHAFVAYSRRLTLEDDEGYGQALWTGIGLYEKAGDLQELIAALTLFSEERPNDPISPDALLRLGMAHLAVGDSARAVDTFVKLRGRHPQSLAAAEASVPLARSYVGQGRERWSLAENVLRGVVEDNPVLGPESRVFQAATWELGKLYYRQGRWGEALAKFEEYAGRYDDADRRGRLLFLRADCYRQAAGDLEDKAGELRVEAQVAATGDQPATGVRRAAQEADRQRRRYLTEAKRLFEATVSIYAQENSHDTLDQTYERLSWFYRADCLYDLGRYVEAIELYDQAAFRYQDDPSALSAYVQIVNSYVAMGRIEDARTANERAKWLLRRIPPEAFDDGSLALSRERWQAWLEWTGESGMW
jgi:tetratricopeptide (TPR) repeat protein